MMGEGKDGLGEVARLRRQLEETRRKLAYITEKLVEVDWKIEAAEREIDALKLSAPDLAEVEEPFRTAVGLRGEMEASKVELERIIEQIEQRLWELGER